MLHVAEVATLYPSVRRDPRLLEMVDLIRAKADGQGRYTPESVWKAWGDWEFGQKKQPSPWLTLLVYRILARMQATAA